MEAILLHLDVAHFGIDFHTNETVGGLGLHWMHFGAQNKSAFVRVTFSHALNCIPICVLVHLENNAKIPCEEKNSLESAFT